jgi:hypothetical protein
MASNIGTDALFTTPNMKPASGEQVDALWGQNIADNTGFLYFRKVFGPYFGFSQPASAAAGTYRGTHYFEKSLGKATFLGSFIGSVSTGNPIFSIHMNGTSIFSDNATGTLYNAAIGTVLTGISNGAMVEVGWRVIVPSGAGECNFSFSGWQQT